MSCAPLLRRYGDTDEEDPMPDPTTHDLRVPGATLRYDVRPSDPEGAAVLLMIGSPMGAAGFGTLATHFTDRTVVTYDPRGVERSERDDPSAELSPPIHAGDVAAVIDAVGGGPVDVFASSGGAMNALALVAEHPDLVGTLVAHEPPAVSLLPDSDQVFAAARAVHDTYQRAGWGAGMAHFITMVSHRGPMADDWATTPAPDPSMFGMPGEDDGSRDDVMLANFLPGISFVPDAAALRAASTTIVLAVGEGSEGEIAHRGGVAVAELLGEAAVVFPSDHGGFLGGEYGQSGDPDAFAARLREVLDGAR
jgi:pimeloyl-ACP methyl ester carboxylesterase